MIRGPLLATAGKKVLERKQRLRDAIKDELGERGLSRAKRQCSDKHLFLKMKIALLEFSFAKFF